MAEYSPEQWRRMLKLDELEDREHLPRGTLTSVLKQESGGKSTVVSPAGAAGLFQLMPATAASYKADRFNPEQSADAAAKELGQHYRRYDGNMQQTLAAWNWGSGNLQKKGLANAPAETKGFTSRVMAFLSPRSAEAATPSRSKWEDILPGGPPGTETATTTATPPRQPAQAPATSKWEEILPGGPPGEPTAPSVTGLPAEQPPAPRVAPAPSQRPQPPTARSTPEQDAAYGQWATQQPVEDILSQMQRPRPAPGAPVGTPPPPPAVSGQQAPTEPSDMVIDIEKQEPPPDTGSTPESRARAQMLQPYPNTVIDEPEALSRQWDEAGAASTDPAWWSGADPASPRHEQWLKSSPMPSTREVAREVAATGVEGAYGVLGTMAGTAIGGPPGGVAGGIAGQSFGRRVTNQAGLRSQEPYIATGFGMNLYPSDVMNAGMGLLTGGPALFKAALRKTTAGKAIVQAEMSTKEAYQAWQIERQRLQAAQKTGQQAELNIALKDHATAEANYKRLVQQRNDTIATNKTEYDQAVKDFETGVMQKHEAEVAKDVTAQQSQAAAIPEARAIPAPYAEGTPSHVLYKEMRGRYSNEPLTLTQGQADLKDLRANRPKTLAGTPSPFEGEVETIAQGLEKATGANVATIHEELKKLGPLTRHRDGKIRGDAKQLMGILMDVLETAPEAAGAIKAANTRFKREMSLEDMNDWLKPGHGVISTRRGKDTINPDAFLNKFRKEMADSKLFRDSFTPDEAATIEGNMRALAERTPRMPTRQLTAPTPESMQTMPGRPTLTETPEVPPIYPEFPKPGQPAGLTVPLTPPAKVPPEPESTTVWPTGKQIDPHTGKRVRIPPPTDAWTAPQWEAYAKQELAKRPGIGKQLMGAAAGAGGMAFALQRIGVPIATVNGALFTSAGLAGGAAVGRYGDWLMSRMLLNDRYRPLLQAALLDNGTVNPLFYNAALAALTPEDRKEYERMTRSKEAQKARR